jgi:hypothetical protein
MSEQPRVLYKYLAESRPDVLSRLTIRFTQPSSLNDPFDCRPPAYVTFTERNACLPTLTIGSLSLKGLLLPGVIGTLFFSQIAGDSEEMQWTPGTLLEVSLSGGFVAQDATQDLGVLCLSERWDSLLMWSHYSNSHKGFVIGLRTEHDFFGSGTELLKDKELFEIGKDVSTRTLPIRYGIDRNLP